MTRIVRLEEIDGDLVLRVPADMAARLSLAAGEDVTVSDVERSLTVERFAGGAEDERLLDRIFEEEDTVLAALAR